ncbi:MAG: PTS sugar transporter subunit IIC [Synergistaceae bacterium]|nr:PTS sugar transporter subunit IIC [Synergistaceae bacterium]
MQNNTVSAFLERKGMEFSFKRYFVDALGAMGVGLFASLITGLILKTIGTKAGVPILVEFGGLASSMVGPAIAVAIAQALRAPQMVVFSCVAVGLAGNTWGGPVGAFIGAVFAAEFGKIISKETKIDIIATPAGTIIAGMGIAKLAGPTLSAMMTGLGLIIMRATELQPGPMGAIVSAVMGMILTLPISSAAIAVALNLSGIAAGAATVGCSTQMIGFAVMSFRENGISGLLSQGIGTSMLQMPNIVRHPMIWVPPTLASAILGPISTLVFKMTNIPSGAGMGTSGLVGQFGAIDAMGSSTSVLFQIALMHFILPAITTLVIADIMRRTGLIKDGDMKLDL